MLFVDCPNKRALNAIPNKSKTKTFFALSMVGFKEQKTIQYNS